MNIKEASRLSAMPSKTIRYYEEIGLISPARSANGYRDFSQEDVQKLSFLARSRSLGFSIEECRKLLSLYEDRGRASADVKALAVEHMGRIERKIEELEALKDTLSGWVTRCQGDQSSDCPILDNLASG